MNKSNISTLVILILAAMFYGAYFVFSKYMIIQSIHPLSIAFSVAVVLSIYIVIGVLFNQKPIKELKVFNWFKSIPLLLAGIGVAGVSPILLVYGQVTTSATNSAFIFQLAPLFAGILGIIFLKEKPRIYFWLSVLLIIWGLFWLTTRGGLTPPNVGDLLILIIAFLFGAYNVIAQKFSTQLSPLALSNLRMLLGNVLVMIVVGILLGKDAMVALIQFPVITMLGALFVYSYVFATHIGIKKLGASNTTALLTITALFSASYAPFIGEILTPIQLLGGLIVIGGVVLLIQKGIAIQYKVPTKNVSSSK
ncbi:MAG: DMT family transporter [Patescibacteria group bacterium]